MNGNWYSEPCNIRTRLAVAQHHNTATPNASLLLTAAVPDGLAPFGYSGDVLKSPLTLALTARAADRKPDGNMVGVSAMDFETSTRPDRLPNIPHFVGPPRNESHDQHLAPRCSQS